MKGSYRRDVDERVLGLSGKGNVGCGGWTPYCPKREGGRMSDQFYLYGVPTPKLMEKVRSRGPAVIGDGEWELL